METLSPFLHLFLRAKPCSWLGRSLLIDPRMIIEVVGRVGPQGKSGGYSREGGMDMYWTGRNNRFLNIYLFLIDWWLLYNIGLISVTHQHELPIGVHMSPPSWICLPPPILLHPSRLLQNPSLSSLSHIANSHWLSILHMVVYMLPCYSLHSSHPLLPLRNLCPEVCFLCLHLYCCPEDSGSSVPSF